MISLRTFLLLSRRIFVRALFTTFLQTFKFNGVRNFKLSTAASYRIAFSLIIGFQAILLAYAPLYFTSLGYTPFEVSLISGMENIAGILGPALLVTRVYPAGLGVTILSGVSGLLMIFISPVFGALFLIIAWALSLFFNRGVFVLINEEAQAKERDGHINYSEARSWGSASFLIVMYAVGVIVGKYGLPWAMKIGVVILLLLSLIGLNIREQIKEEHRKSVLQFLRESFNLWHLIFYLSLTLVWASHGPAYTYMSIHLLNLGWTPGEMALSWNIAVITEIIIFLIFKRIQQYASLEFLLTVAQIACIIRWTIIATTSNSALITLSQILHGLTFGLCFVVSQKLLINNVEAEYRKPAFAIFFATTMGFGSLLGKLIAGWSTRSAEFTGDFHHTFLLGTYLALLSLIVWYSRRFIKRT